MGALTTNTQLIDAAKRNHLPLNAVVFKDELQHIPVRDGAYIINLDNTNKNGGNGGTHWCAFYIEGKKAFYFDPFAVHPPEAVERYLSKYDTRMSVKQIQNIFSNVCGYYCLFFIYYMTKEKGQQPFFQRAYSFLNLFSSDPKDNLKLLECYLKPLK